MDQNDESIPSHFKRLLEKPCFEGYSPRIVDQVFYLEKYVKDQSAPSKSIFVPEIPTEVEYENPVYYVSFFEIALILLNLCAIIGIFFTIYIYCIVFQGIFTVVN